MNKTVLKLSATLLIPLWVFTANLVWAVSHPYEFHADARMAQKGYGPIDKVYGYMNVITDESGNGTINVMFSNGSQLNQAQFNARVKFLDASGVVIREELFDGWVPGRGIDGASESKLTKPLPLTEFDAIQVEFYLSDIPATGPTAAIFD